AVDQLHHERTGTVRFFNAIDVSDVGVVQGREHFGLAPKAPKPFRIARERLGQHFDRDIALQRRIARAIDLAHAACAYLHRNFIRAEASGGGERHRAGIIGDTAISPDYYPKGIGKPANGTALNVPLMWTRATGRWFM